jgi:hypothetical protein
VALQLRTADLYAVSRVCSVWLAIFFIQPPRSGTPGWLFVNKLAISGGCPPPSVGAKGGVVTANREVDGWDGVW